MHINPVLLAVGSMDHLPWSAISLITETLDPSYQSRNGWYSPCVLLGGGGFTGRQYGPTPTATWRY
jgi:hypothetical protein